MPRIINIWHAFRTANLLTDAKMQEYKILSKGNWEWHKKEILSWLDNYSRLKVRSSPTVTYWAICLLQGDIWESLNFPALHQSDVTYSSVQYHLTYIFSHTCGTDHTLKIYNTFYIWPKVGQLQPWPLNLLTELKFKFKFKSSFENHPIQQDLVSLVKLFSAPTCLWLLLVVLWQSCRAEFLASDHEHVEIWSPDLWR